MKIVAANFDRDSLNELYLWRYLDIFKLLDLLNTSELHFTRLDHFEDTLEGLTVKDLHEKAITSGPRLSYDNLNPIFDDETKRELTEGDQNRRANLQINIKRKQQTQYANCWFLGAKESYAMWKLYSGDNGLVLKFPARDLVDLTLQAVKSLEIKEKWGFAYGPINYKNLWPLDNSENFQEGSISSLKKDISYEHEKEFRFISAVATDPDSDAYLHTRSFFRLKVERLWDLKFEVICSPFMEKWKKDNLNSFLSKKLGRALKESQIQIR